MDTVSAFTVQSVILNGIPDPGVDGLRAQTDGRAMDVTFLGTAAFMSHMPADIRAWEHVYLPVTTTPELHLPRKPLVNHMADADFYGAALGQATTIVESTGFPCFNDPRAISALRRDRLPDLLAGIAGVTVPRCFKIRPGSLEELAAAVRANGLAYPVIARLSATHGGKTQTLVQDEAEWARLNAIPWGGRELYVTQFHDCLDPDGFYRKQRVAIVGDRILPRHGAGGRSWSVDAVEKLPDFLEEELAWPPAFERTVLPVVESRVREILSRVKLDYFGIDYCLRPDGTMVIFEVSAAMSMTEQYVPETHRVIGQYTLNIRRALADLLRKPHAWWATGQSGSTTTALWR